MPDLQEHRERCIGYTTEFWGVVTRKQAGSKQARQWWGPSINQIWGGDSKAWGRGAVTLSGQWISYMKCSETGYMGGQDLGEVWMLGEL